MTKLKHVTHLGRKKKKHDAPSNFFNYLLRNFPSSEHPEWQSGSDSTAARRGQTEQGGGRLGCVKHEKKGSEIWREIIPPWLL